MFGMSSTVTTWSTLIPVFSSFVPMTNLDSNSLIIKPKNLLWALILAVVKLKLLGQLLLIPWYFGTISMLSWTGAVYSKLKPKGIKNYHTIKNILKIKPNSWIYIDWNQLWDRRWPTIRRRRSSGEYTTEQKEWNNEYFHSDWLIDI